MPSDPRCHNCDGKVSATATWCMHCGADFAEPDEGRRAVARSGGAESTLARVVRSFDRNAGTREVLALVVATAALFVLVGVGALRGGLPVALLGGVALGLYLRVCGDAKRIVVHGAYGTAALVVLVRVVSTGLVPAGDPFAMLRDGLSLLVVGLLVAAGWWTDRRIRARV